MADQSQETTSEQPGDDYTITGPDGDSLTLINSIREYKSEAEDAKRSRLVRNRENVDAYMGIQDWSHKQEGQSKEFLPKTPVAVEQFVGFVKRALTQFGQWYDVETGRGPNPPLSGAAIRTLMNCFLDDLLVGDNVRSTFALQMTDGLKVGSLESLCIFKVHGNMSPRRTFRADFAESGDAELIATETEQWDLRIDLVDPRHYNPDPTGQGLYEIHTVERDLHVVKRMAERGVYDADAVARLTEDMQLNEEDQRDPEEMGQDETVKPSFRKKVVIDEFWGTIVDGDGNVLHENVLCTIGNDKYVLRKPMVNPLWHGESPFVAFPLIRVPFSVWHKALFDGAVQLNFVQNELFNLIIDGGLASVWGIKQVRIDDLDNPSEISGGIPQGATIAVKSTLPHGQKAIESVADGNVPSDSMAVLEMLSREFAAAALSNELKMGSMPPKQVLATEVVEMSQSQAVTLDALTGDIEREITMLLRKVWLTILQNLEDVTSGRVVDAIGIRAAYKLGSMSAAERYAAFANSSCSFRVHGLSALMAKVRDFQKFASLMQIVGSNPLLFQAFFKRYSPDKVLGSMMKMLAINPERIEKDAEETARAEEDFKGMMQFAAVMGAQGGQPGQIQGPAADGEPVTAEINASANPTSALAGSGGS